MITGRVTGASDAHVAAGQLRRMARTHMSRSIRVGMDHAIEDVLPPVLEASILAHAPSGFAPTLLAATHWKSKPQLTTSSMVKIELIIWASGVGEMRDLRAMDRGILRHPVFANRDNWVAQVIPPNMIHGAVDRIRRPMVESINAELERLCARFNSGGAGL